MSTKSGCDIAHSADILNQIMQAICISVSFFRVICIIHLFLVVFCVTIASVTQNCEAFSSKHEITVDFLMNDWIPVQESKRCACNITCRFFTVPPQTGLEKPSWKYPTNHDVVIMMHYLHTFADGERVRDFPEQIFGYLELEPPISGNLLATSSLRYELFNMASHVAYALAFVTCSCVILMTNACITFRTCSESS